MNIAELAGNLGLTKDEYLELVGLLVETGRVDLEHAEAAMKRRDPKEASHRLHSLKGASANLGLMDIYKEAREGEQMAKQGMLDPLAETIRTLKSRLDSLADLANRLKAA